MTEAAGTLAEALVAFQAEAPVIAKSRTVAVETKSGGHYQFSYAPHDVVLDAVRPVLAKHGLAVTQLLDSLEPRDLSAGGVRTILVHKSGERLEGVFPLPIRSDMTPQEIGSAITYIRRYALVSILGLATEDDDDANHASGNTSSAAAPQKPPASEPPSATAPSSGGEPQPKTTGPAQDPGDPSEPQIEAQQPGTGGAGRIRVPFGKHKGKTLLEILDQDRGYVKWLSVASQNQAVREAAAVLVGEEDLPF